MGFIYILWCCVVSFCAFGSLISAVWDGAGPAGFVLAIALCGIAIANFAAAMDTLTRRQWALVWGPRLIATVLVLLLGYFAFGAAVLLTRGVPLPEIGDPNPVLTVEQGLTILIFHFVLSVPPTWIVWRLAKANRRPPIDAFPGESLSE